jgi:hypothetical protein
MAKYIVETFVWSDNDGWLFDFEVTLDTRNIVWFDWDDAGSSDRWGKMVEMKLAVNGYYYYYHIKYDDASFLNAKC